jgi:hypothetical protein
MFATNFLTNPSSKVAAAAYEAARAASCNPDATGRCRRGRRRAGCGLADIGLRKTRELGMQGAVDVCEVGLEFRVE